jgi:hypothetical protein
MVADFRIALLRREPAYSFADQFAAMPDGDNLVCIVNVIGLRSGLTKLNKGPRKHGGEEKKCGDRKSFLGLHAPTT